MPQGFLSLLALTAPCRITRHFLDRSSTAAGLLVELVDLVYFVCLVYLVSSVQPNKLDKRNKPNNGLHTRHDPSARR